MRPVRMMIEDYDLMAHARRTWLGWVRGRQAQGVEPSAEERRAVQSLEGDTRLDSAVLMVWESSSDGDLGWVVALRWLLARVGEDMILPSIPESERGHYLASRRAAIERTLSKLDASAVTS